ncbi:MAG: hypothetical protein JWR84_262 [Caulobacter sp.]|nr:hypothetical protein [Caulobacter sp.]
MTAHLPVLLIHILAGTLASVTGFVALFSPKGAWLHRRAGVIYVAAMMLLAVTTAGLGVIIAKPGNIFAGAFAFYLVLSSWLAVRRPAGTFGWVERVSALIPLTMAVLTIAGAVTVLTLPGGPPADLPPGERPPVALAIGFVALLAAGLDVRVMLKGGLSGTARIARHLWRMCAAMFIATGSFGAQIPVMLKRIDVGPPPLLVDFGPALLVLVLLAFWMIRVRIGPRFKGV